MEWLNYHHLLYFWTVVRTGSIAAACAELRLAPPTVSAQIKRLEQALGEELLAKSGRGVVPTEVGRLVFRYAEDIFSTGRELLDAVRQRPGDRPLRVAIGVDDVLPKEIVHALVQPVLALEQPVRLLFREAPLQRLLAELELLELDVVLSDAPVTPTPEGRLFNHPLGECGVVWMAVPELAARHRRSFPRSLESAPVLLPTRDTALRRGLDLWLLARDVRARVHAEFEDFALMITFGERGLGLFPAPAVLEGELRARHGLRRVGVATGVRSQFFAISAERRLENPAVVALSRAATRLLASPGRRPGRGASR
ncbi:MAG: LysR family transcriptional regulator [Vicinamibacteria bacterium]|nr:LysR family transcriptional regulator [Vicinamibacteria bacterium]